MVHSFPTRRSSDLFPLEAIAMASYALSGVFPLFFRSMTNTAVLAPRNFPWLKCYLPTPDESVLLEFTVSVKLVDGSYNVSKITAFFTTTGEITRVFQKIDTLHGNPISYNVNCDPISYELVIPVAVEFATGTLMIIPQTIPSPVAIEIALMGNSGPVVVK